MLPYKAKLFPNHKICGYWCLRQQCWLLTFNNPSFLIQFSNFYAEILMEFVFNYPVWTLGRCSLIEYRDLHTHGVHGSPIIQEFKYITTVISSVIINNLSFYWFRLCFRSLCHIQGSICLPVSLQMCRHAAQYTIPIYLSVVTVFDSKYQSPFFGYLAIISQLLLWKC